MERGPMNPFERARGLSTHDAWTQGVKCSHPEADAADSENSYLEIKKRFESVRWRSVGILYPSCASRQVSAQEATGRFLPPLSEVVGFSPTPDDCTKLKRVDESLQIPACSF